MEGVPQVDEQGNEVILSLERKSVKPYRTQDEYLYAMKEDLADWFHKLYGLDIEEENFFEVLETGVVLCEHANTVQSRILEKQAELGTSAMDGQVHLPEKGVQYRTNVKSGSFQSRDNIANFIAWCRGLGLNDVILFESDDLVERKNERHVVLCLLEVARRGARYGGMLAPVLVQLEEEIEAEINAEITGEEPPPPPPRPRRMNDLMSLDEMVRELVNRCTCPDQFPMVRVSEGKYRIGDSQTLIFVRILRNHVMVRIGGGWDTLENYLDRHDPCRCNLRGHRARSTPIGLGATKRRGSASQPGITDTRTRLTPDPIPERQDNTQRSKRSQSLASSQSTTTETPKRGALQSHHTFDSSQSTASKASVANIPDRKPGKQLQVPSSGKFYHTSSSGDEEVEEEMARLSSWSGTDGPCEPSGWKQGRPSSAAGRIRQSSLTPVSFSKGYGSRGPTPERDMVHYEEEESGIYQSRGRGSTSMPVKHTRSRSVGPSELSKQVYKTPPASMSVRKTSPSAKSKAQTTLMIARDSTGRHRISGGVNRTDTAPTQGDDSRRSQRTPISPDRILPDKPKVMNRSKTIDIASAVGDSNSGLQESEGSSSAKYHRQRSSSTSNSALSLAPNFDDYGEAPPEDEAAFYEMEKVFEELLRQERARNGPCLRQRSKSADILDSDDTADCFIEYDQQPFQKGGRDRLDSNSSRESSVSRGVSPMKVVRPAESRTTATTTTPGTPRRRSSPNVLGKTTLTPYKAASGRSSPATSRESSAPSSPKKSPIGSKENLTNKSLSRRPVSATSHQRTLSGSNSYKYRSQENLLDSDGSQAASRKSSLQAKSRSRSRDNLLDGPRKPLTKTSKSRSTSRENLLDDKSLTPARAQRSNSSASLPSRNSPAREQQAARSQSFQSRSPSVEHSGNQTNISRRSPARELSATGQQEQIQRAQNNIIQTMNMGKHQEKPKLADIEVDMNKEEVKAKPRRDEKREGPRTKIPMPVSMRDGENDKDSFGEPLRRYDSGVDINNMSPTEASIHGDDAWQDDVLVMVPETMNMTNHTLTLANDPDYF